MGAGGPRFRRDLSASNVEAEGVPYVEVTDQRNGKSFRFYDFEYAVAQKLDGRSLDAVASELRGTSDLDLTVEQLSAFGDQLQSLGFLEAEAVPVFPPLVDDESGSFDTSSLLGKTKEQKAPVPDRPPPTPAPPADSMSSEPARSVTEQTITSFPPDLRPAGWPGTEVTASGEDDDDSNGAASERPAAAVALPPTASSPILAMASPPPTTAAALPDTGPVPPARPAASSVDFATDVPAEETVLDQERPAEAKVPEFEDTTPATEAGPRRNGQSIVSVRIPSGPADKPKLSVLDDDDDDEDAPKAGLGGMVSPVPGAVNRQLSSGNLTPAATSSGRPSWPAYAALGIAAAAIIAAMVYKFMASPEPPAITVRAVVPSPTTVYRWFDVSSRVDRVEAPAFTFGTDGKVAEIVATGTRYGAGDVLALLESGKRARTELTHNRERLAYYEQLRDSMTQQNNRSEVRQAELKVAEKQRKIAEAQATLAKHAIIALQPGEVSEALVQAGAAVKANQPVLRAKGTSYRAVFELPKADADKARQLGFCRVELEDRPLDCSLAAEGGDDTHLVVELPADPAVAAGKAARLARERLDAVFVIPANALVRMGDSDRLYVVAGSRAELRVVGVAERTANEATIQQGLDVGDRVIINNPPGLKPDARVLISETVAK